MVQQAQSVLKSTLASLEVEKAKIERQIQAVRNALSAIADMTIAKNSAPRSKLLARRKRRPMGAAERKSVSRRMKAYWAKRRAERSGKP